MGPRSSQFQSLCVNEAKVLIQGQHIHFTHTSFSLFTPFFSLALYSFYWVFGFSFIFQFTKYMASNVRHSENKGDLKHPPL